MRSAARASLRGGRGGRWGAHRGRGGVAVVLQERHRGRLAGAQLLQLGLQQVLLGLQLGLAAQRHLQPLQLLLQHLPLAQQVNPAGGREGSAGRREDRWEAATGRTPSPLAGVDALLLLPELPLQLSDHFLPAQHRLGGRSQLVCHRGEPVPERRAAVGPASQMRPADPWHPPPRPGAHVCCTLSTVSSFSCSSPGSRASLSSSSDSSNVTQGGMSGVDLGESVPGQGTGQRPWCPARARRGLPVLSQEALVLSVRLDAGDGRSHGLVKGHHLVLHQAADLQVLLQDLLPADRQDPGQRGLGPARGWEAWGP